MDKRVIIVILAVSCFLSWHWLEPTARKNRRGINAYEARKYKQALEEFMSARKVKPDMAALKSNTASALYQMKKYKEALEEFSGFDPQKAGIPAADYHYNVGNSFFRLNQFDKALEYYKKSLVLNPQDMAARKNFELTLKKLEDQKKQQQDKQKQQQDQQKDQQDQQKDQQDKEKEQQQQQQQQQQKPEQKHRNLMQYLNQNEKKQLEKRKRAIGIAKKAKDW
jgi:tetratricopeptide (TPR) repeat protein